VITLLIVAGAIATMIMAVYRRERGAF